MKKLLILFILVFLFLPFSADAAYVGQCDQYQGGSKQFFDCLLAKEKGYSLCFNRDFNFDKSEENRCIANFIKSEGSVSLCNNFLSDKTRNDLTLINLYPNADKLELCLMKFAVDKDDVSVCGVTIMDSLCQGEFAFKNNNYNLCVQSRNIYDGIPEGLCFQHVALRSNNSAVCDEIIKPIYKIARAGSNRESCLSAIMVKNEDVDGCKKLSVKQRGYCLSEISQSRMGENITVNPSVLNFFEKALKWWGVISVLIFGLLAFLFHRKDVREFHIPIFLILCAPFLAIFRVLYKSNDYSNLPVAGGDANFHSFVLLFYFILILCSLGMILKSGYDYWLSKNNEWRRYRVAFFVYLIIFDYLLFTIWGFANNVVDNLLYKSGGEVVRSVVFSENILLSVVFGSYLLFYGGLLVLVYWYRSFKKKKELNMKNGYISLVYAVLLILLGSVSAFFTFVWWLNGNFSM